MSLGAYPNVLGGTSPAGVYTLLNPVGAANAGGTGPVTQNASAGQVQFAAAAASLVVTNSLVTATSRIFCQIATNDATMVNTQVVAAAGSFTIFATAAPTATTRVNWCIV